jgi:hypothetical protein
MQFGSVIEKIKETWDHTQNTVPCHNQPQALSAEQKHFDTGKKKSKDMLVTMIDKQLRFERLPVVKSNLKKQKYRDV